MSNLTEDEKEIFRMAFTFKTIVYLLGGVGLVFFGLLSHPWYMTMLFSLVGLSGIIFAGSDLFCYLTKKYLIGEIPQQSDREVAEN